MDFLPYWKILSTSIQFIFYPKLTLVITRESNWFVSAFLNIFCSSSRCLYWNINEPQFIQALLFVFSWERCDGGLLYRTNHQLWFKDAPVTKETNSSAASSPEHPPCPLLRAGPTCSGSGMKNYISSVVSWSIFIELNTSILLFVQH